MKNVVDVEIPKVIRDNCKFSDKGLSYPYIILEEKGIHYFKINDQYKVMECIIEKKCTICGTHLKDDMWFIGGPASAFHTNGAFNDAPVHKACGVYALKVCPYLVYTGYKTKTDVEKLQQSFDSIKLLNNTVDFDRVPLFAFVKSSGYTVNPRSLSLKPIIPYLEVEFWEDGQKIPDEEGMKIVKEHFMKKYSENDLIINNFKTK